MLDYKKAAEILKEDEPDFYQFLESEYPDGFPLLTDKFAFWQELGEKEFPEDFSILSCSKLDAFTFYAGVKFFKEKCFINNELIFPAFTVATDLKNYQALKIACMNAFVSPDSLERHYDNQSGGSLCLHFAVQLREYYVAAGDMYLANIYRIWAEAKKNVEYAYQALEAFRSAEIRGWKSAQYDALKRYDKDIDYSISQAIERLNNQLDIREAESVTPGFSAVV